MEEIIPYNQLVDHFDAANKDNEISDDVYKFRALIDHQGSLKATDPKWKGYKYDILGEWKIGEKTFEPLSVLAADDPVTCATYAKEKDLLHVDGWKRFRNLAKRDKILTRAVKQSNIRQAKRSNNLAFDKENNNTKWVDATRDEMDYIKEQEVFTK